MCATLGIDAPMAAAVPTVAAARRDDLDESGGCYVHVIVDGGVGNCWATLSKALATGADAVTRSVSPSRVVDRRPWSRRTTAPPKGHHAKLPRGCCVARRQALPSSRRSCTPARRGRHCRSSSGRWRNRRRRFNNCEMKEFQRARGLRARPLYESLSARRPDQRPPNPPEP